MHRCLGQTSNLPVRPVSGLHFWGEYVRGMRLQAVKDRTGREDLVAHLRRALLLDLSSRLGCNKVTIPAVIICTMTCLSPKPKSVLMH